MPDVGRFGRLGAEMNLRRRRGGCRKASGPRFACRARDPTSCTSRSLPPSMMISVRQGIVLARAEPEFGRPMRSSGSLRRESRRTRCGRDRRCRAAYWWRALKAKKRVVLLMP